MLRDGVAAGRGAVLPNDDGFAVHADVLPPELLAPLPAVFAAEVSGRAGVRTGFGHDAVRALACSPRVRALVEPLLGRDAFAYRATLFDKNDAADWMVAWHQDLVVPVAARTADDGFGPWSHKDDGPYVQPPEPVLRELLAVRVALDGEHEGNGGLRVLPRTHASGVLGTARLRELAATVPGITPHVPPRGATVLSPLLVHGSARAHGGGPRRTVHLEFAARELPGATRFRERVR
jgi:hypothetical protein